MARRNTLRFQVTAADGRCSDVWRAWSDGNNVYLAPRMKGGEFKISLHESGKWRFAFTKEYAELMGRLGTWGANERHRLFWSTAKGAAFRTEPGMQGIWRRPYR